MFSKFQFFFAFLLLIGLSCQNKPVEKINGLSFVAPSREISKEAFNSVVNVNANWVSIMPFAYCETGKSKLRYNIDWQWWGERKIGTIGSINMAKDKGLKIMLKPHIWIRHGSFTGDYKLENEKDWLEFEEGFRNYTIDYAKIAQELNVEIYCIGTEMKSFFLERPDFWGKLIDEVRAVYKGKLTYAGNWDSYKFFPHWQKLDFIGVDAYFPLSKAISPTKEELIKGWQKPLEELKSIQEKHNKPILFTEFGYRSCDKTGDKPWETKRGGTVNLQAQVNAYEAIFDVFWKENWFAGGFVWKWFDFHEKSGGKEDNRFTPQNKPAEDVIKKQFKSDTIP